MSAEARTFIDTNVLLYLLSADERKADIAEALLADSRVERVISTQVVSEFASAARRKAGLAWHEICAFIELFRDRCTVEPVGGDDQDLALDIADTLGFHWYDSLIVATALRAEAVVLLSEDLQHRQRIATLTIRNPFRKTAPRGAQ